MCLVILAPFNKGTPAYPVSGPYILIYYTFSVSLNAILTILIVIRLLWYRKTVGSIFGKDSIEIYLSATSILVESQVLYPIAGIAFLILYSINIKLGLAIINVPSMFTVSIINH